MILSSFGAKWWARTRKLVAESRKGFGKFEWPSARSSRMVGGVHRKSRRHIITSLIEYLSESSKTTKWRYSRSSIGRPRAILQKLKKEGNNEATRSRLRGLPDWLEVISKIQTCRHPHTLLMTQVRNVLRKWHPRSTYLYSLPKRPKWRNLQVNKYYEGSLQEAHWRSSTSGRFFLGRKGWKETAERMLTENKSATSHGPPRTPLNPPTLWADRPTREHLLRPRQDPQNWETPKNTRMPCCKTRTTFVSIFATNLRTLTLARPSVHRVLWRPPDSWWIPRTRHSIVLPFRRPPQRVYNGHQPTVPHACALLVSSGLQQSRADGVRRVWTGCTCCGQDAPDRDVNCQLCSLEQRKTAGQHLNGAFVVGGNCHVHVAELGLPPHCGPCLATHTGECAFGSNCACT